MIPQYFLRIISIAFICTIVPIFGQSPGGVTPAAWYKADASGTLFSDAGVTGSANNSTVYQWNDAQGNGFNLLQATAGLRPTFSNSTTLANFNPTVTFQSKWMEFQPGAGVNIIDRTNGTLFTAGYLNTLTQGGIFGFDSTMDYPGLHTSNNGLNNLLFFTGGPGYQGVTTNSFQSNFYFTAGANWQNGAGTNASYAASTVSLNGSRTDYSGSQLQNAVLDVNARDIRVGGDTNYGSINGQVNEMLIFENRLTADEMDRVESYLAIKYGTTYAQGTRDYKNSASGVVWSASGNTGYNNNIAGIARDATGLNQKQSWSTNSGKQVLISTTGLANTNAANATSLNNGQYLIWGDNGLKQSLAVPISGITGVNYRFESIWKTQNTGSVGTVRIAWPSGLANLRLIQSADAAISNTDTVTDMSVNTQTVNGVIYNYADVTLANGQYFTFAAYMQTPGGVALPAVWLRANDGTNTTTTGSNVTSWVNYGLSGGTAVQAYTGSPVFQNAIHNFNPSVTDNTLSTHDGLVLADVFPDFSHRDLSTFVLQSQANLAQQLTMVSFGNNVVPGSSLDVPWFASQSATESYFFWQDNYQATPNYPNSLSRFSNIPTINSYYLPKWISGTHITTLSMNGATSTASGGVNTNRGIGNNLFIHEDGGTNNSSGGNISEVISFDRVLTDTEKLQVNSYLGIKYGITLTNALGTLPTDYLNRSAAVVWNSTTNTGYNSNIVGIAREDDGALNQKQSKSVNDGQKLIIGAGNSLADTNALNTNSLTNGQFLIVGDNGLKQGLSVALANPAAPGGATSYRFASIWKVQNTSSVGTVTVAWPSTGMQGFHLVRSSDATIDATDTFIPMSGTTTVNGVTYNTATVTFGDGNYFTFAAYVHAPGGVLSSLWYRADKGVAPATGAVTTWTDYSAGKVPVVPTLSSSTSAPTSVTGTGLNLNFNPGVTFVPANALGNTSVLNALSGANYTVYTSTTPVTGNNWDRIMGLNYSNLTGGNSYDSPGLGADNVIVRTNTAAAPLFSTVATGYRYNQLTNTTIVRNSFTNTLFTRAFNGAVPGGNITYSSITTGPDGGIILGRNANAGGDDDGAGMTMSETIVFDGTLSANDVNKVDSYLAIKGGITLNTANTPNYLSSSSTNVWNGSVNTGYNNNIFGIAYDYVSDLHQKQSKSINDGQKLIIGAGGALANTNALNTNTLTDGQFLMVGDNGLKQSLTIPISGITGVNYRFESIWKTQNTGSVGTVRIIWPAGLTSLRLIQSADAVIDNTDTVTDMSLNTQTVNGVTYNYADVTLANGQYFTFAAFGHAPGGVINGLSQWYRADIDAANTGNSTDVTSWKDYFAGTVSAQIAGKALPKYKVGDVTSFNYNPGVSFTAITQTLGNNTTQTITNTSNDVFTLTKSGITSPSSPNPHFFSITANNATTDASSWDYLGFLPSTVIERRPVGGGTQLPGSGLDYSATIPSIMYNTFTNTTLARGLNGAANVGTVNTGAMGLALGGHVFGDTRWTGNTSDNGGIIGDIGETIIYGGGNITTAERRKVDTYLAIKYGITLGRVATDHYIATEGSTVWSGALNTTYNNNVFGVAKDNIEAFDQKVSKSVNAGTILTVATTNNFVLPNLDASRSAFTNDVTYFLLGDNNITTTPLTNLTVSSALYRRIARTWLSQRTNTPGGLYFESNLVAYTGIGTTLGKTVFMLIADDPAFTTNVKVVSGTSTGSGKWVFNNSFDTDNTARYITFAEGDALTACYKPGAVASVGNPALISKVGISSLNRAGAAGDNWPAVRTGAWLVLEAKTKGFVPNRLAFSAGNPVGIAPANFVEGMLVYDITNKCMKMYTSQDGGTTYGWYCLTTQTCPD